MLTMKSFLPLILVIAACWASDPIFDDVPPELIQEVSGNYRLPGDVVPTNYEITLEPIFESPKNNFSFNGKSVITLEIKNATSTIKFHAKELEFVEEDAILTYEETDEKSKKKVTKTAKPEFSDDPQKDFVILTFKDKIETQENAKLSLNYTGILNDDLRGFYRSSYQNKDGKKTWLATTQFEPVGARQAFPCWDEPELKATFNIAIKVPQGYKAVSNMRVKSDKDGLTVFNPTPIMSTYLVAFVVSDFKTKENKDKTFGVLAKPTVEDSAKEFAFDYGLQTLEELKSYTGIDYYGKTGQSMQKMDQIAIPDFAAGAMENWGLVTYREPRLLYVVNKTTTADKQAIGTVIAHEFAHQWFGNLVTCKWWNSIWLNEGFATFFQYYISDKVIPKLDEDDDWRLMEQFVIKNLQASSFVVDATSKTRPLNPVETSIQTPVQIKSLFDDIAYKKGASILNMMNGFLTEKVFQEGLKEYLKKHKSEAVTSDDLFNSIQNSDKKKLADYLPKGVTLKEVMDNWVNKPGYPVVTVTWNATSEQFDVTQERFFLLKSPKEDETQWYVPINFVTEEDPEEVLPADRKSRWLTEKVMSIENLNKTKWILFNKDQTGYYRVNYDNENWVRLSEYLLTLDYKNISATNRAQLIDDALNLARAGRLKYTTALNITSYLSNEIDYIPWYAAARALNYLDSVLLGGKNYTAYQIYVASKTANFVKEANYENPENGTHVDKLAKVLALNTACRYELEDCKKFVNERLAKWLEQNPKDNKQILVPDLRSGILCAGLRNAEVDTWNKALEKYKTIQDKDEKADVLAGLGCAKSKEIANRFLKSSLEENSVVDVFAAMNSVCAGNPESFDVLIEFINTYIEDIQKADKKDNSRLISLLNKLSSRIVSAKQFTELSILVHGKLQVIDKVEGLTVAIENLAWIKNYREEVENWIEENCKACQSMPDSATSITLASLLLIASLLLTRFY
ncbi:aminopeptidase N-like [Temnothorax curvispinosus]|uniref:Aminopeptidase n=1 Tax=Temnothorax curvispinosus TaxID=300111 RepID=A0A6J1Q713_9HYME|nr:aminopeptidase N-like [Temnothorax curvispinosus]